MSRQRLSKVLAAAGVASRRTAEEVIRAGRVRVHGAVIRVPQTLVDPEQDPISVDNEPLARAPQKVYYALNKPVGFHCTNASTVRRRAVDLIDESKKTRLFTVGRLDKETSGLILVTNDGHFANAVMHPSGGIKKEYIAKVNKEITPEHLKALSSGCLIDGVRVRPVQVTKVRRATVRIIIQEGRRHEVRELIASAGLTVVELKRVRIGNLSLGRLPAGGSKKISPEDVGIVLPGPSGLGGPAA